MTDKVVDLIFIGIWILSLGLVFYLAVKWQQLRSQVVLKTIDAKDAEIEKEINAEPLSDLVNLNNKSQGTGTDGKS